MIGRLLGLREIESTAKCAHFARDSVQDAAVRVATSIAEDIL